MNRIYLCIDLKTFYASVECAERGLDPFKTNLVVADPERGKGTICLAITPAMKALGIHNRCRVFDIPKDVKYITAEPRMNLYIKYSANIYEIYLKYISKDDIYVYSIDECFLDVTNYLKYYNIDELTLAKRIMKDIFDTYHITATAGIGTNLFLAKVALDVLSKHSPDNIGILDEEKFKDQIWFHEPITDIWNIGPGISKRLMKYGVKNLYGVTKLNPEVLYKEFGVNAELIIDHANGIEPATISEIKAYKPTNHSLSSGQVLFRDYTFDEARLVTLEMIELLVEDLIDKHLVTNGVSLFIGYSTDNFSDKRYFGSGGSLALEEYTNSYKKLRDSIMSIYDEKVSRKLLIRRVNIGFGKTIDESHKTYDFFTDILGEEKEIKMNKAIISLKKKFGKNSIIKGMDLCDEATTRMRNDLVGGHKGGKTK